MVNAFVLVAILWFPSIARSLSAFWIVILSIISIAKLLKKTKPIETKIDEEVNNVVE